LFPDGCCYIYAFKGRIYALVDDTGRTITVGPEDDQKVQLAAEPLVNNCGDLKYLLESEGELLLFDINHYGELIVHVFRLDVNERKWVEFKNLEYSFFASVSVLCVLNGNCIIFIDEIFFYHMNLKHGMSIFQFNLDGHLSPFSHHPEYIILH
jgi:hypothetical protein